MQFHTFVFDSDYLKAKLISLENCCLLSTKLPMKHPRVFFSRNPSFDCQCEILVIELGGEDGLARFKRTQKEARTVLVAADALNGLDAFLGSGKNCATVFMSADNTILKLEGEEHQAVSTVMELPRFAAECGVADVINPRESGSSLDSKVLKKTSWLTGTFISRRISPNGEEKASFPGFSSPSQRTSSSPLDIISPQNIEESHVNNGWAICSSNPGRGNRNKESCAEKNCGQDFKALSESPVDGLIKIMKNPKKLSISSSAPSFGLSSNVAASPVKTRSSLAKIRGNKRILVSHLKALYLGEDCHNTESSDCVFQSGSTSFCDGWINIENGDHIYRTRADSKRCLYNNIKNAMKYVRKEKKNNYHGRSSSRSQ